MFQPNEIIRVHAHPVDGRARLGVFLHYTHDHNAGRIAVVRTFTDGKPNTHGYELHEIEAR